MEETPQPANITEETRIKNLFKAYGNPIPLQPGTRHFLISQNHEFFPVKVEIALTEGDQYYIHFLNNNKRLDRWVQITDLRPLLSIRSLDNALTSRPIQVASSSPQTLQSSTRRCSTRRELARRNEELEEPINNPYEVSYYKKTSIKNIRNVFMGDTMFECWYFSPFPGVFKNLDTLFVCEFCFYYFRTSTGLKTHLKECNYWHPPGDEIYRDTEKRVSVFEVDGNESARVSLYCQCLCLFGKFFLERKTLFYDVKHFKFYVVTKFIENKGYTVMGFFSKEKKNPENNLSCIVVFPNFQNFGVGKFMVMLSYELSRREKVVSGPERPISDLGRLLYKSFWMEELLKGILKINRNTCTSELAHVTGITEMHVKSTLEQIDLTRYYKGQYVIPFDKNVMEKYSKFFMKVKKLPMNKEYLKVVRRE